jgi:hypothetical protein
MLDAHIAVRFWLLPRSRTVGMLLLWGWSSAGERCWCAAAAATVLHSAASGAVVLEAARCSSCSRPVGVYSSREVALALRVSLHAKQAGTTLGLPLRAAASHIQLY